MNVSPVGYRPVDLAAARPAQLKVPGRLGPSDARPGGAPKAADAAAEQEVLRRTFESAIGQTLFGQMLKAMRKSQGKPAYFHGGRAEEAFQQQLDQVLAEKMAQSSAPSFAGPMFELFSLQRK